MATAPGLQTGKVIKLENDPAGEYRILLQLLSVKAKDVWARYSNFDAGQKRGSYFMPEIGDEVLVGFINDDWSQPVVLGMLYSRDHPPVRAHRDNNHLRSYTSRSGMHLLFDDNSKTIEIQTQDGNQVKMDEQGHGIEIKDQNLNKILLNNNGITIKSNSGLTIETTSQLNIKSASKLTLDANEIEIKARANIKLAGTNISSTASGNAELKGTLVKIN